MNPWAGLPVFMLEYQMADGVFEFWTASGDDGGWSYVFRVPKNHKPEAWAPVMAAANSSTPYRLPCRRSTSTEISLWFKANPKHRRAA